MSNAGVSVILPVHNAAATVRRAVQSILDQTHAELELIIVDDGSTDETPHQILRLRDPRICFRRIDHQGVVVASRVAVDAAQFNLIARMDADDIAWPDKLRQQRLWMERHGLDVVGCQVRILNEDGTSSSAMRRYQTWINTETLSSDDLLQLRYVELPLVNPTILARRHYFEPGYQQSDLPEDYDLMLTAAAEGMQFGKVPEVLFDWYDGRHRLTRRDDRYSPAAFDRCRLKHLLAGPLSQHTEVDLWGLGRTGRQWFRHLTHSGCRVRRIIEINPDRIDTFYKNTPIIDAMELNEYDGTPMVIAVGTAGARPLIRSHLNVRGFAVGTNALFVA